MVHVLISAATLAFVYTVDAEMQLMQMSVHGPDGLEAATLRTDSTADYVLIPQRGCAGPGRESGWLTVGKPYTPAACAIGCATYNYFTIAWKDANCKCADQCTDENGGHTSYAFVQASTPAPTLAPTPSPTAFPTPYPTDFPTAFPTPSPTPSPTQATSSSSAIGDPHLQNMFGQRFDLVRPGTAVLVSVPRGTPVDDALLVVKADARRLGAHCSDMYFQEINATGTWANKARPGGFHFDARDARDETPKWLKLGLVELKVGSGHTDKGQPYLNVYIKNLQHTGYRVGGLLGEDDHTEAAAPEEGCQKMLSLDARVYSQAADLQGSVAVGY
ncbi:unnamed protein product [Prorocentrum cordatum]|uniref:Uncharacterized protein n=1 Tax=Prorocentrum cordatum TaxID=2364126 RepID=A0ABN9TD65_9DINO|nr:unnamed protein product [Polarella glacialis]